MPNEVIIFDSEIVPSHYLVCMRRLSDRKEISLWGHKAEDMQRLAGLLANPNLTWVGFNSLNFDLPLMTAAAGGATVPELKAMADRIIAQRRPAWMTYRDEGLQQPSVDHIDLIEVAPGVKVSLKLYDARMGSPSLQDMPFHHDDWLTAEQAPVLEEYCLHDLDATERLWLSQAGPIALREKLSEKYGIDLRSKSDAQAAETIIAKELNLLRAPKPEMPRTVRYHAPKFIQPKGAILKDILQRVEKHVFQITQTNGAVELPEFLKKEPVLMGDGVFQMGVGGLHSKHDKCVSHVATPEFVIRDADVAAFYPRLLLNAGYIPRGMGKPFINIYKGFVDDRVAAKHEAQRLKKLPSLTPEQKVKLDTCVVMDAGGKIMINGTFGKLGSCFSKIYSPDLMLGITLSGQFYLLTLIEHLVDIGVRVLSANTDGVTFGGTPDKVEEATKFIELYGWLSNFEFEFVDYARISFKDVNNYIAIKTNGEVKAKGLYAESGLMKNPTNEVCAMAAGQYLGKGVVVDQFVKQHLTIENLPDFLQSRTVNGGAVFGETKLGRVARWYYSTDPACANGLRYATNGNLVPKSTGGRPVLTLPPSVPADLDVQRYVDETIINLGNMGVAYQHGS